MKKLTKKELRRMREGHIALWTWLAETGSEDKKKWAGWEKYGKQPHDCFCCGLVGLSGDGHDDFTACQYCPIDWEDKEVCGDMGACTFGESEFELWSYCDLVTERKRLAAKIATMWPEVK